MKIAQLGARSIPAQHGGLEVVVESLARELASRGHDITVYVSESDSPIDGVTIIRSRSVRGKYTHTASQLISTIFSMRGSDYDIVHVHGVGPAFILLLAPILGWKARTVVTAHGLDWERKKWPRLAAMVFRGVSRRALRSAASISAVSVSTAESLEREIEQQVTVIGNGISIPELPDRSPLDLPAQYSVCMCRLTPEKNIERILDAYSDQVASQLGPLVIVGGGAGSYAGDYESALRAHDNPHVIWAGSLARPSALAIVRDAAAFISMSTMEAQPMSVLEAVALGVPVVLSPIAPHREIGGSNAVYADPDSSSDVEGALLRVAAGVPKSDPSSPTATSSWSEIAEQYESWYEETLEFAGGEQVGKQGRWSFGSRVHPTS